MIRFFRLAALLASASIVVFAQSPHPTDIESLEKTLKSSSNLSGDFATVRKRMAAIFNLRKGLKPEIADALVCAAAAGLVAVGDTEAYAKVRGCLQDPESFEDEISADCTRCGGSGRSSIKCQNCKGSGKCPNSRCEDGMTQQIQLSGPPLTKKCSICSGTGQCKQCRGAGLFDVACPVCKGKRRHIDRGKARDYYGISIANATRMLDGSAKENMEINVRSSLPEIPIPAENHNMITRNRSSWHSWTMTSLSNGETASRILQGLDRNKSGISKRFQDHEFNFEDYRQWNNEGSTKIQKDKILERLYSKGLKSGFYKDFIRCYFALVPDGLSFVVTEVSDQSYENVNGPIVYCVTIELLCEGASYQTESGSEEWKGHPWQNVDLLDYLSENALFPSSLSLLISIDKEEVVSWKKGKILTSKGWIYDIQIWNAFVSYTDGSSRTIQDIRSSKTVFRSIDERIELEGEF